MGMDLCLNRSPALLATAVQINAQARAADEVLPSNQPFLPYLFQLSLTSTAAA